MGFSKNVGWRMGTGTPFRILRKHHVKLCIIAKLSIRNLGPSPVLIYHGGIISTNDDPSLRIESFAMINLLVVHANLQRAY